MSWKKNGSLVDFQALGLMVKLCCCDEARCHKQLIVAAQTNVSFYCSRGAVLREGTVSSELTALGVIKGLKQRGVNFSLWIEFQNHP